VRPVSFEFYGEGLGAVLGVAAGRATSRAIAETGVPDDDARMIVARRTRIGFPRRAMLET
jgi:hypothetical protein